jgi:hypothetical protein
MNRYEPLNQLAAQVEQLQKQLNRLETRGGSVPQVANTTTVQIALSITETEIFRRRIYADQFGTSGLVRVSFEMLAANTTGAPQTVSLRTYFGGSAAILSTLTLPSNANGYGIFYEIWLRGSGTTATQVISTEVRCARRDETVMSIYDNAAAAITEDTTADKDLYVTAQLGANIANLSFTKRSAHWVGPM